MEYHFDLQTFLIFDAVIRQARHRNHKLLFAWPLVCFNTYSTCRLVIFIIFNSFDFQSIVGHNLILYIFR